MDFLRRQTNSKAIVLWISGSRVVGELHDMVIMKIRQKESWGMAYYVTRKCPHCGKSYQVMRRAGEWDYGCSLQECFHCGNKFIDTNVKEPALYGYDNLHEENQAALQVLAYLVFGAISILAIVICAMGFYYKSVDLWGLCIGAFGVGGLCIIVSSLKKDARSQNKESLQERQKEYDSSFERLQNMHYLSMLAKYDSRAKNLLKEKKEGKEEHYASRP